MGNYVCEREDVIVPGNVLLLLSLSSNVYMLNKDTFYTLDDYKTTNFAINCFD